MRNAGDSQTRRLFFACWPDPAVREEIIARRALIAGISKRSVPNDNLHLTLVFLGNQPADCIEALCSAAASVTSPDFAFNLDRFGWFAGARVAWLGGAANEASRLLVQRLAASMRDLGLVFDERGFIPHITLFRQVKQHPEFPVPPRLIWPVDRFSLIESVASRPYQVLRTWPLKL